MKHKTAELEGALLDAAVALAADIPGKLLRAGDGMASFFKDDDRAFQPSRCWEDGGPLIERERITLYNPWSLTTWEAGMDAYVHAEYDSALLDMSHKMTGPTPLIAAMRAFVASKLGEEVELPG